MRDAMARRSSRKAAPRARRPRARPARARRGRSAPLPRAPRATAPPASSWKGRDSSPVLERYPTKEANAPVGAATPAPSVARAARPTGPSVTAAPPPAVAAAVPGPGSVATPTPPRGLITLDTAFDVDGFSQSLGETSLRVVVPREDLVEVLRRVTDFMGFGIYVYALRVYPEPAETLRRFVVELQRVDYSEERRAWLPFEEKGVSDSPFGPSST